ncbi:hypothetical protein RIVM261_063880 [Rivularia sp. IAM M-261]|nr:hypothetical protein CAL7716_050320 [Calothrix sp. PCC 7716]GJD21432.1 hypothetical protein RIVM261_063880 [Rivularia sp. IAM M-261]
MLGFTPNRSLHKQLKQMYARLVIFFRLRLAQVGLKGRYQPEEILSEAVLRLEHALKMGKNIYNQEAWLKTTGFFYILELRRHETKFTTLNIDVSEISSKSLCIQNSHTIGVEQLETEETYKLLGNSILELQASERELLVMRFFDNMSWNDIAQFYASRGKNISVTTLRQRGSRVLKCLRKVYRNKMRLLPPDKPDV